MHAPKFPILPFAVLALLGGFYSVSAVADDQSPVWHGFLTSGLVFSDSSTPYDGGIDRRPDFSRYSNLGLNLEEHVDPRWDFAAQIVTVADSITLDWGFATFYPAKGLSIRFGKQKVPLWLNSDHVDVGHTYPWVTPPDEIYHLNPINTINGLGMTYALSVGGLDLAADFLASTASPATVYTSEGMGQVSTTPVSMRDFYCANLSIGTDLLQLRGSIARGTSSSSTPTYQLEDLTATFTSIGFKGEWHKWQLIAEYAHTYGKIPGSETKAADAALGAAEAQYAQTKNPLDGQVLQQAAIQDAVAHSDPVGGAAWYATIGYQFGDFEPLLTAARLISPANGLAYRSQDSATVGARYDFTLKTDLKLQGEHVWPRDNSNGLYDVDPTGATQYKQLNVYSAAIDLAF